MRIALVLPVLAMCGLLQVAHAEPETTAVAAEVEYAELPTPRESQPTNLPRAPVQSSFLRALVAPNEARADALVRQGRALLSPAVGMGLLAGDVALQRRLAVENALARFEQVVHIAPTHLEARLCLATTLASWQERTSDGVLHEKTAEAIAQLEALRALDPLYEAQEVAFQLGLLFTRQADFARAVTEYRRALAMRSDDSDDTTLLSNLAEVTMLSGDVAGALAQYDRAAREAAGSDRVLALWGSAVALDRLGESYAALVQARRALQEDRAPFAVLHQGGVFFVPEYEVHYYEALGHLALAHVEREGSEPWSTWVQRGKASLEKPAQRSALPSFEAALTELSHTDAKQAVAPLALRLTRLRTGRGPSAPTPSMRSEAPAAPEARALLGLLRALAAFELYLQRGGSTGPFALQAQDHVAWIEAWLTAPR